MRATPRLLLGNANASSKRQRHGTLTEHHTHNEQSFAQWFTTFPQNSYFHPSDKITNKTPAQQNQPEGKNHTSHYYSGTEGHVTPRVRALTHKHNTTEA